MRMNLKRLFRVERYGEGIVKSATYLGRDNPILSPHSSLVIYSTTRWRYEMKDKTGAMPEEIFTSTVFGIGDKVGLYGNRFFGIAAFFHLGQEASNIFRADFVNVGLL